MKNLENRVPRFHYRMFLETIKILLSLYLIIIIGGCKKLITVDAPVTSTNEANVYSSDATAAAVLTGIYTNLSNANFSSGNPPAINALSLFSGLSADELRLFSGSTNTTYLTYYQNSLSSNVAGASFWMPFYQTLFSVNSSIEGLTNSSDLSLNVKQQLLGEAKFIRAFCYFYLTQLYGDVPFVINSNYKVNSLLGRAAMAEILQQVVNDLKESQNLLSQNYVGPDLITNTKERVRPNKWVATALLARVYLYTSDFVNAEKQATEIINNSTLYSLDTLNAVFLKNSREAIWQLQPVRSGINTQDAMLFIMPSSGPSNSWPVYLNKNLLDSFEFGDNRRIKWVNSVTPVSPGTVTYYYPYKYKATTFSSGLPSEYLMVFRLAEQYLIRAESRAQQSNISGAQNDLNVIRNRAGLMNTIANDKISLLSAILHERQIELFSEWGHRWLDLKRTGRIDEVMKIACTQKGGNWSANWQWYPVPLSELQADPNLSQNQGY